MQKGLSKIIKIILGFFGLIIVLGIIGSLMIPVEETGKVTETLEEETTTTIMTTTTIAKPYDYEREQIFAIGDVKYAVAEDVLTFPILGSEFYSVQADGIYVVIGIAVENAGDDEIYFSFSSFKLKDYKNRKYDASTTGAIYLQSMGLTAMPMMKELGPGLSTSGYIVFDVPENDKGLILEISGPGLLAGKKTVNIGDI